MLYSSVYVSEIFVSVNIATYMLCKSGQAYHHPMPMKAHYEHEPLSTLATRANEHAIPCTELTNSDLNVFVNDSRTIFFS